MKKSLVALAVLGVFAGAASAQSSVTLYGIIDVGYDAIDTDVLGAPKTSGLVSGVQSGSRWGLRGSEDLGGGLKANFQLESGFSNDTGLSAQGGRLFGRAAWAGLGGGFGELRLGRMQTAGSEIVVPIDPFGTGFNLAGMQATFALATTDRADNSVMYRSPTVGGFAGIVSYSFRKDGTEVAGSGNNVSGVSAGLRLEVGPFLGVLGYQSDNNPSGNDAKTVVVGATYDAKIVKIHAAYGTESDGFATTIGGAQSSIAPSSFTGVSFGRSAPNFDAKTYMFGATVPFGSSAVLFSYRNRDAENQDNVARQDGRVISLGYTYAFSRRTNFRAYFSDSDAKNVVNANDRKEYGLGIRHLF
jgi:predicted porin